MKGLTRKQKGFVKDYAQSGNGTQAALNNYDVEDGKLPKERVAAAIASENLTKPNIIKAIADMLPDELIAEKHLALLNKVDEKGEIDVQAVKAGVDMAHKIKGSYAPEQHKHDHGSIIVIKAYE